MKAQLFRVLKVLPLPKFLLATGLFVVAATAASFISSQSNSQPQGFLVAKHELEPTSPVSASDFETVTANIPQNTARYLDSLALASLEDRNRVYPRRLVAKGEFLRSSDLLSSRELTSTLISIDLDLTPASSLVAGSSADIWATAKSTNPEPTQIAVAVQVQSITVQVSSFGGATKAKAELMVSQLEVPGILAAVAEGDQLALVPVNAPHIAIR